MDLTRQRFDYIVVGAGAAGAIVATRLTEDPQVTVLLLEAGGEDETIWTKIPLGFAKTITDERYVWNFETDPEPELHHRRYALTCGKVIGGSTAINGMIYIRGLRLDYDGWADAGAPGWSYEDVLPYFRKLESWVGGADSYHGDTGPIGVENARWKNPLADAFLEALAAIGVDRNPDINGHSAEGGGYTPHNTRRGRRSSTGEAYIKPSRNRRNLLVITQATVTRINFKGKEARGVTFEVGGQPHSVDATREVILSAGALHSPQLLQLSGVGPGRLLQELGIDVVHDLKGVGENLQDHLQTGLTFETTSRDTFNRTMANPFSQVRSAFNYFLGARNGALSIGVSVASCFVHTRLPPSEPDVLMHFLPYLPGPSGWDLSKASGFRMALFTCRPESRGSLRILSKNPHMTPRTIFNHLSTEEDRRSMVDGLLFARRVSQTAPLDKLIVRELTPGFPHAREGEMLDFIRQTASTSFHYCGTARMGKDPAAVVDENLKVRGLSRLRVIDASIMPTIPSSNSNPAALMIGEKGADLVKQDWQA